MSWVVAQANVPKLRFPEFAGEWAQSRLSSFVDNKRKITYGIVQPGTFVEKGIPLVRGGDYSDGWVSLNEIKRVTPEIDRPYKRSKLQGGDLLLTIVGANTGTVAVVPEWLQDANITQTTARVAVDKSVAEPGFIEQVLRSRSGRREVYKYIKGAAQPGLNLGDVEKFAITAPKLSEQKKIARFLGITDAKIALLKRRAEALKAYKSGMMQRLFSGELRFTCDDGSSFPDWQEKRFCQLFSRVTRKNLKGNTNVLTISARQGLVSQKEYFGKSVSASDVTGYYLLKRGDFAYNKSYSKGFPLGAIKCLSKYDQGVVSTLYICFAPKEVRDTSFYEKYFDYGGLNRELHKIAQEGARNHGLLNLSVVEFFRDIRVPYPHPDERTKIASFLSALDRKIDAVTAQLSAIQALKKGLLQQMFV